MPAALVQRTPGKYGLIHRAPYRWVPKLEDYLTGQLPAAPAVVDRASQVTSWPMYFNGPSPSNPPNLKDGCGDCTCATVGHQIQAWTAYAQTEITIAPSDILDLYETVGGYVPGDPSTDNGCQPEDVLNYWMNTGVAGHRIDSWATLGDPTNLTLMKQCLNVFGSVYLAIQVPQSAEQQFAEQQPWMPVPGSQILGGHAIPLQRWDDGHLGSMEVVTWAALQRMTLRFARDNILSAYVIVTKDWLAANGESITGLNLAELRADLAYA